MYILFCSAALTRPSQNEPGTLICLPTATSTFFSCGSTEKSFRLFWLLAFPPFFFLLPLGGMIIWLSCKSDTDCDCPVQSVPSVQFVLAVPATR